MINPQKIRFWRFLLAIKVFRLGLDILPPDDEAAKFMAIKIADALREWLSWFENNQKLQQERVENAREDQRRHV